MIEAMITEIRQNYYSVVVNGNIADGLTKDEALGVIASALFSNDYVFVRPYEAWLAWAERFYGLDRTGQLLLTCDTPYTQHIKKIKTNDTRQHANRTGQA